jgi:sporulation protein YlmC with PRC-barrel domain
VNQRARGKILHGQLHLLDRQIVEHGTGRMVAKVDDVEIDFSGEQPFVSSLLTGPAAWGARLPGVLGRIVTGVHRRLHPAEDPQPHAIDMSHVVEIGSAVHVDSRDLGTRGLGDWLDAHVIGRIPGARDAAE